MAIRIHAAKTYKVEWGSGVMGDLNSDDVNAIIMDAANDVWYNSDDCYSADELEIPMDSFEDMLKRLEEMSEDEFVERYHLRTNYDRQLYPKSEFIKGMQYLYDSADKSNDFIRVSWY